MPVELNTLRLQLLELVREQGGATDPLVADALRTVPRHLFLPDRPPAEAYQDDAIVTKRNADGQPISSSSQPTIMAIMLDQLAVRRGQRVLEIGAGTGFNAALLAKIVGERGRVTSVDLDADTVERARENLDAAGCGDVVLVTGDGALGHQDNAPYDRIIATVGVWDLAPAWGAQLAPGGRLVVPLDLHGVQRSVAFERGGDHWTSLSARPCGFMRMRGPFAGPERIYQLSPALTLSLPKAREIDTDAVAAVLTEPQADVRHRRRAVRLAEMYDGLGLWLAVREPCCCAVSEVVGGDRPMLLDPPLRAAESVATIGILGDDGIALLGTADDELAVHGYGNDAVADTLVAHVRDWDAAGRPGTDGCGSTRTQLGVPCPPGGVVLEKSACRLVLSW